MKNIKSLLYKSILKCIIFLISILLFDIVVFASADNSLSHLSIEGVQLEPSFQYSRLKYNGTVEHDVTQVQIKAITSNRRAKILRISGNNNLKVGTNTIYITVQAKNGQKATYSIILTRKSGEIVTDELHKEEINEGQNKIKNNSKKEKKSKIKKLKKKLKKQEEEIEGLNNTLVDLKQEYETVKTNYETILLENQKIYSQRIFMVIMILLLFFTLIIALFIGSIKKMTNRYIKEEFNIKSDTLFAVRKRTHRTSVSLNEKNKKENKFREDDDNDYAVMNRVPRNRSTKDTLLENIETVIEREIKSNNGYSANTSQSMYDEQMTIDNHANSKVRDSKNKENTALTSKEKEKFSFDIIEI